MKGVNIASALATRLKVRVSVGFSKDGNIVEIYSYDVFGEPNRTSDVGNPYLFTGRRYDNETGLYYYRARYYNPEIGRFMQTDTIGYVAGLNLYAYVLNNPVNLVDPTGGCSSEVPDEIAEEVIKEVIKKYGSFDLDKLKDACLKHESGCGSMVDCQMCGDLKCLMKIPATLAAFHNCIKAEYLKCF